MSTCAKKKDFGNFVSKYNVLVNGLGFLYRKSYVEHIEKIAIFCNVVSFFFFLKKNYCFYFWVLKFPYILDLWNTSLAKANLSWNNFKSLFQLRASQAYSKVNSQIEASNFSTSACQIYKVPWTKLITEHFLYEVVKA